MNLYKKFNKNKENQRCKISYNSFFRASSNLSRITFRPRISHIHGHCLQPHHACQYSKSFGHYPKLPEYMHNCKKMALHSSVPSFDGSALPSTIR